MSQSDRSRWEQRYADKASEPLRPVAPFLSTHADLLHGRILDIASGSGRNAIWLARRGAIVHCIDIAGTGLRAAHAAARRERLPLVCLQADLEMFPLRADHYDAVINIRFLQRSLFAALRRTVRHGGLIFLDTFLADDRAQGQPRNPDFLLRPGELAQAFAGFEILHAYEGPSDEPGDRGYVARLIARRPRTERD